MGFLGRVSKESGEQPGTTVIAGSTKVVGDLQLNDDFHLDGTLSGKLTSTRNVSIGVNGEFDGQIVAQKVVISGRFDGSIDAERLEIVSTGRVGGEVKVAELVIEPGGQFNGNSQIRAANSEPRRIAFQGSRDKTTATSGSPDQDEKLDEDNMPSDARVASDLT